MLIGELRVGVTDTMGFKIRTIYGYNPPSYAVYRTSERVVVHYADDPQTAIAQRKALVPLNPLRGQINGLIDGWRRPRVAHRGAETGDVEPTLLTKADSYDRRVGDALTLALEGDVKTAADLLATVRAEILSERVSWARMEYLSLAFGLMLLVFAIVAFVTHFVLFSREELDLWRAAAAGGVGAFFSLALSVHGRTILPDLQRMANWLDALLRMIIGVIAAIVLLDLVRTGAVTIALGTNDASSQNAWASVLMIGFLAGFSERLVADLLAQTSRAGGGPPSAPPKAASGAGRNEPA